MILYPTETIYALGVNALDEGELEKLFVLKGREVGKSVSWLVRDVADIERWGALTPAAAAIAKHWLPGSLTLVLRARDSVARPLRGSGDTVSFRISTDPVAQQLIAEFMAEHDAPLTCTSANVSGCPPAASPEKILQQFQAAGRDNSTIYRTIDDGVRAGAPSTVVRVIEDRVEVLREGAIPTADILSSVAQ